MKTIDQSFSIILASQSPRRQNLLKELGLNFEIRLKDIEEVFDPEMPAREIAPYLANLKSRAFQNELNPGELLITADTTVVLDNQVINKPQDRTDAIHMLSRLSGNMHEVVTGVSLRTVDRHHTFSEITKVYFKALKQAEIEHYIDTYEPYDKAGSYGIQEWIGYVGIPKIKGCFFNVMGLPLYRLNEELGKF